MTKYLPLMTLFTVCVTSAAQAVLPPDNLAQHQAAMRDLQGCIVSGKQSTPPSDGRAAAVKAACASQISRARLEMHKIVDWEQNQAQSSMLSSSRATREELRAKAHSQADARLDGEIDAFLAAP